MSSPEQTTSRHMPHGPSNRTASQPPLHRDRSTTSPFNQPFTPLKSTFWLRTRHALSRQACRRSGVIVPRAEARWPIIPSKDYETQPRPSNSVSSLTNTTEFTEPPSPPRITSSRQLRADAHAAVIPSAADDQNIFWSWIISVPTSLVDSKPLPQWP